MTSISRSVTRPPRSVERREPRSGGRRRPGSVVQRVSQARVSGIGVSVIGLVMLAVTPAGSQSRPVVKVALFEQGAARPAFSQQGDRIAFDRQGSDGRYDIYLRELGQSGLRCLTCTARELRHRNNLRPGWDPSGELVVFLGQALPERFGVEREDLLTPDRSLRSDLFLFRADGKDFWQLTRVGEMQTAILDARFSHEAGHLTWTQRLGAKGGAWGRWQLMVGRLEVGRGGAHLEGVRKYEPPTRPSLIVAQEFLPDDRAVLVSANFEEGQGDDGLDIYAVGLDDESLIRLTHSRSQIDEFAHLSPTGKHIVWSTNSGLARREAPGILPARLRRDLWIMERDGSEKQRLTFFNGGGEESVGEAYVGDFTWHPEGDRLVVHVLYPVEDHLDEALFEVTLEESFRRP